MDRWNAGFCLDERERGLQRGDGVLSRSVYMTGGWEKS